MDKYKDVQGGKPKHLLKVDRVGVRNVRVPVSVKRGKENFNLSLTLNVFVDLPEWRKGADMSRTIEAINSIVGGQERKLNYKRLKRALLHADRTALPVLCRPQPHLHGQKLQ